MASVRDATDGSSAGATSRNLRPRSLEVSDGGIHAGDVLVHIRAGLELVRHDVGDEVLAKRRQTVDRLAAAPREAHVRREDLVSRTDQVVAVERLHVDRSVRRVVHRIEEDLGADGVCALRDSATSTRLPVAFEAIVQATSLVRSRQQRLEILRVQPGAIVADARVPPDDAGAGALEREPGRHVRLVIEIADDDLGPRSRASARRPG